MKTHRVILLGLMWGVALTVQTTVLAQAPAPVDATPTAVYFANDVMPRLTKLGCGATACHGSAAGKGGFRLSMFGANPQRDYDTLSKADEGRRINRIEPAQSLFLLKATASIPHEGGKRLEIGSPEYNLMLAWVAQGMPWRNPQAPELTAVQVEPKVATMTKDQTQQLKVVATYSDGSQRDVTHHATFPPQPSAVASINDSGLVTATGLGEAHVIVTYMRQFDTARIIVPQALPTPFPDFPANNQIDVLVAARLRELGIPPSDLCTDHEFIRRVYVDAIGTLPTSDEVRAFLADANPQKRSLLVDHLLQRPEYADFCALRWGDLLRIKSEYPHNVWPKAAQTYYRWVWESFSNNKPYDQFARELLTATGGNFRNGPVNFFRAVPQKDPQNFAEGAALVFMGARLGCASCHGHPYTSWDREDMVGMAAFFAQIRFKITQEWKEEIVYADPKGLLWDPTLGKVVPPKYLDGAGAELANPQEDPRGKLVDWLTSPDNPWFARNAVNRVWFWVMGRGIIHEPDDIRPTNPPENPELLHYLEQEFVSNHYDLKHVLRLILNSRTYQLSSRTNEWNRGDVAHFSHYGARRLGAEQLLDAISQVTETTETFVSPVPAPWVQLPAGFRATQIPDTNIEHPFLEVFGRSSRNTPFESERSCTAAMRQALYLVNSDQLEGKVANSPRIARLIQQNKNNAEAIAELYLTALCRPPTEDETNKLVTFVANRSDPPLQQPLAEQKAAQEALTAVNAELAKADAELEAIQEAKQTAEAAAAQAKLVADQAAADQAAAEQAATTRRQQAAEAKLALTALVTQQQQVAVQLAAAAQAVTDVVAAKVPADQALLNANAAVTAAEQALAAAEQAAQQAEANAKAISEDASKSEEEKQQAAADATAKRAAATAAKGVLTQAQQAQQQAQAQAAELAKQLTESTAQRKSAAESSQSVANQVTEATTTQQTAEKAAEDADAAVASAKATAEQARTAHANADTAAAQQRQLAGETQAGRDKLAANQQAATARLAQATENLKAAWPAHVQLKQQALQDVLWALLNSKEFLFNH